MGVWGGGWGRSETRGYDFFQHCLFGGIPEASPNLANGPYFLIRSLYVSATQKISDPGQAQPRPIPAQTTCDLLASFLEALLMQNTNGICDLAPPLHPQNQDCIFQHLATSRNQNYSNILQPSPWSLRFPGVGTRFLMHFGVTFPQISNASKTMVCAEIFGPDTTFCALDTTFRTRHVFGIIVILV